MKKIIQVTYILISVFLIGVFVFSCKNPAGAVEEIPKPGSRDYKWTADTVRLPFFTLIRIWGSSFDNVWAAGFGGDVKTYIWHFDGKAWTTDSIPRPIDPTGLFGFNKSNVWLGNSTFYAHKTSFWFYNGNSWFDFGDYAVPQNYDRFWINDLYGTSPNDVYAVGTADSYSSDSVKGIIMHFNGKTWSFIDAGTNRLNLVNIRKSDINNLYFIKAFNVRGDTSKILSFDGKNLREAYSNTQNSVLQNIHNEAYVVIGQKIYKYSNGGLYVWKDFSGTTYGGMVKGWSEADFFYAAIDGIGHYNGSDLKTLYKTDLIIMDGIAVPGNIFFITHNFSNGDNVFIRGELQQTNK